MIYDTWWKIVLKVNNIFFQAFSADNTVDIVFSLWLFGIEGKVGKIKDLCVAALSHNGTR